MKCLVFATEKRGAIPCGYACTAPMCAPTCPTYCCAPPPAPPQQIHHTTHIHHHHVHHMGPQAPAMPAPPQMAPPPATVHSQQHVWEYVPPPPPCPCPMPASTTGRRACPSPMSTSMLCTWPNLPSSVPTNVLQEAIRIRASTVYIQGICNSVGDVVYGVVLWCVVMVSAVNSTATPRKRPEENIKP